MRRKVPAGVNDAILTACRRRCCLCFGLDGDDAEQEGQIAHLDHDPSNNDPDNLTFMCLKHHNRYDTKTSQAKGLTEGEARNYLAALHEHISKALTPQSALSVATDSDSPPDHVPQEEFEADLVTSNSTIFFSDRFAQAFPGIRKTTWFNQPDANGRLSILLKAPLNAYSGNRSYDPIWYWRSRGEEEIRLFEVLPDGLALLGVHELEIEEIAAVYSPAYYRQFVYVKTRASAPTGLYRDYDPLDSHESIGDVTEEYALFDGHRIRREEFDDGAAVIGGKPVDVRGVAKLRKRYLTASNLLIAPKNSPINEQSFDKHRKELLVGILQGTHSVADLTDAIFALPRKAWSE